MVLIKVPPPYFSTNHKYKRRAATSSTINIKTKIMIKMTILYGHPTDDKAFEAYYANTHMSIALKMEGQTKVELT